MGVVGAELFYFIARVCEELFDTAAVRFFKTMVTFVRTGALKWSSLSTVGIVTTPKVEIANALNQLSLTSGTHRKSPSQFSFCVRFFPSFVFLQEHHLECVGKAVRDVDARESQMQRAVISTTFLLEA